MSIAKSAVFGNVGFLVGSGFSKAVMLDGDIDVALSWNELLEQATEKMSINYSAINKEGKSYPQIATKVCKLVAKKESISYADATMRFKTRVCSLTNWHPDKETREKFGAYFKEICPSWIITTNYDMILESILTGVSISLGPNDALINPKNITPIYHLHGVRSNPNSLMVVSLIMV